MHEYMKKRSFKRKRDTKVSERGVYMSKFLDIAKRLICTEPSVYYVPDPHIILKHEEGVVYTPGYLYYNDFDTHYHVYVLLNDKEMPDNVSDMSTEYIIEKGKIKNIHGTSSSLFEIPKRLDLSNIIPDIRKRTFGQVNRIKLSEMLRIYDDASNLIVNKFEGGLVLINNKASTHIGSGTNMMYVSHIPEDMVSLFRDRIEDIVSANPNVVKSENIMIIPKYNLINL